MPEGPNLVVNGGFETGNFFAWTYTDPEPDNPDIGVDNASEDVHSGSYGVFAGNEESTLSQSIATTVGHTYTVSFYLDVYQSAAYGGDFTATFGAVTGVNLHNAAETDGLNGFTQYSFTMTATS